MFTTTVIYHHEERTLARQFCRELQPKGIAFEFPPIGLKMGTEAWRQVVATQLAHADLIFVLLTTKAVLDQLVAWRVEVALSKKKLLIPFCLQREGEMPKREEWLVPVALQQIPMFAMYKDGSLLFARRDIEHLLEQFRPIKCFISYSRTDASVAAKLKADLRKEGISAWVDVEDIPAGAAWDDTIAKEIEDCTHLLLLVSRASVESSNVSDEVGYARDKRRPVLPLLLDNAPIPFRAHRAQAIDFKNDYRAGFDLLIAQLRRDPYGTT